VPIADIPEIMLIDVASGRTDGEKRQQLVYMTNSAAPAAAASVRALTPRFAAL
jgi:hypothetical protein